MGLIRGSFADTMGAMNTPDIPREPQSNAALEAKVNQWLELKREMEVLHAQVEYVRLLMKLGVAKKP
jgi:hypothetical protein